MEKPDNSHENTKARFKNWSRQLMFALLMSATPLYAQIENQQSEKILPPSEIISLIESPASKPVLVYTKNNLVRWYYNPQSQSNNIRYAIGATRSPFSSWDETVLLAKQPQSLTETDFYTNYLSALGRADTILFDQITGQPFQDPESFADMISKDGYNIYNGVPFQEDGKQWNVHRFLIEPHYGKSGVSKQEARQNAMFDMYRYFLVTEDGDRQQAAKKSEDFMVDYVDRITQGQFFTWWRSAQAKLSQNSVDDTYTITSAIKPQNILEQIVEHNASQSAGAQNLFSRSEVVLALQNYFIEYERLSADESQQKANLMVSNYEQSLQLQYKAALQQKPQAGHNHVPQDFADLDPVLQQQYLQEHPEAVSQEITQQDIDESILFLRRYKWQEGGILND